MIKFLEEFIDSLTIIFEDIIDDVNIQSVKHNLIFLDLDLDDLWDFLKNKWSYIDSIAIDFSKEYKDFKKRKKNWKLLLRDSEILSDIDFILKYSEFKTYISNLLKENKLTEEKIKFEKESISKNDPKFIAQEIEENLIEWENRKIYSFKIYDNFPLLVNLSIRLEKIRFYNLLIFFTFTIRNPGKEQVFSMELINNYYHSFILSYELLNLLKSFDFRELDKFYVSNETYSSHKKNYYYSTPTQEEIETQPFLFQCSYLNLLHESTLELFTHLSDILRNMSIIIQKCEKINDPKTYYSNFQQDLKEFLKKGKELFSKSFELIYELPEKGDTLTKRKYEKPKITIDKLLDFFQKEYNKDQQNQLTSEDAGFRSLPEIFNLFKDEIKISWATFNKKALEILKNSSKFEIRERQKKGGGKEFRIIPKPTEFIKDQKPVISSEILLSHNIKEEDYENLIMYEEASLYYYDNQLNKTVDLYENIFNSYTEKINEFSWLYCDVTFRLGNIFTNFGLFNIAEFYYTKGKENYRLTEQKSLLFNIEELKLKRLRSGSYNLTNEINELEKKIKDLINKQLNNLNENFEFIDELSIQDLDIYYIRGLKQDPDFKNNPIFQKTVQFDKNLLKLNLLRLDHLRKEIFIQTTKNPLKLFEEDGKKKEIILPENIIQLLDEANKILEQVFKNKFNWGDINFILFELYKTYFENVKNIKKRPYDQGFDYGVPITFFPTYYTKFLFNIINYDWENTIFEPLNKREFLSLDFDSKAEYLVKLCDYKFRIPGLGVRADKFIPFLKNLKTLIQYAINIIEENQIDYLYRLAKKVQADIEKGLKEFLERYKKIKERVKKR